MLLLGSPKKDAKFKNLKGRAIRDIAVAYQKHATPKQTVLQTYSGVLN